MGVWRKTKRLATLSLLAAGPCLAGETDQYLAWMTPLEDSADVVNQQLNTDIAQVLEQINRRNPDRLECEAIPPRIYRHLFRGLLASRFRKFLENDPRIDRVPGGETGYWGYLESSIFRKPAFPFLMPMARTIRIGDVNVGIDKVNHLLGFGRRYYNRYRRALRRGHDEEEALRRVVLWGARMEKYFVGGWIDGIYSHADLEANYQGMRLALDLCGAAPPHLEKREDGWRLARPVDLRDYVNPNLDETYNNNEYASWRWRRVRPILEADYCPQVDEAVVRARRARYRQAASVSPAIEILREHDAAKGHDRQQRHSLMAICEEHSRADRRASR